jgi:hypothetical protein
LHCRQSLKGAISVDQQPAAHRHAQAIHGDLTAEAAGALICAGNDLNRSPDQSRGRGINHRRNVAFRGRFPIYQSAPG